MVQAGMLHGYPIYECLACGYVYEVYYEVVDAAYDRQEDR
jgi:predicted nucleic acid-binding Zn ribbon protein